LRLIFGDPYKEPLEEENKEDKKEIQEMFILNKHLLDSYNID